MIYGANGFTGRLTAHEAARRGLTPVLAGRREEAIRPLAEELGLPWRAFPLDDRARVTRELNGVDLILLLAGPFSQTSKPVVDACIASNTHYLDITGEFEVFEACYALDRAARRAGCVLLPGVGFDVVPSDCLALALKEKMPSAVRLELAIGGGGKPTRGTMKTVVEGMGRPGVIRSGGKLEDVPHVWRTKMVGFRDKERLVAAVPLPDVSSAYRSTGIPNIVCYLGMSKASAFAMKLLRPFMPVTRLTLVQRAMKAAIDRAPMGPDAKMRASARVQLWGRVEDESGRALEATLETQEAYTLTASASVTCAERVLAGAVGQGAKSPAQAFGSGFLALIPGCESLDIIFL
jgi:short subunit dehydrogenase-like uncharacterized protein